MKIFFKLNLLILLASAILGFSSCTDSSEDSSDSSGTFAVRLPGGAERAVYTQADAKFYEVRLVQKKSSLTWSKTGEPGNKIEFKKIPVGTYTIHVYAYKSNAKSIIVAENEPVDVDITADKTEEVFIKMIAKDIVEEEDFSDYTAIASWSELCTALSSYTDTVTLKKILFAGGDSSISETLTVRGNVLIQVAEDTKLTRASSFKDNLIKVNSNASLKLGGAGGGMLTIDGNKSNGATGGSMILVTSGALEIANNCTLQNANLSPADPTYNGGGAIYMSSGQLTLSGGFITGNECNKNGGAIYIGAYTTATLSGTEITGNISTITNQSNSTGGGAIYITCGTSNSTTLTMTGGKITGNSAAVNGGGVFVNAGTFNFNGGTISGNTKGNGTTYSGNQVAVGATATFKINGTSKNSLEADTTL